IGMDGTINIGFGVTNERMIEAFGTKSLISSMLVGIDGRTFLNDFTDNFADLIAPCFGDHASTNLAFLGVVPAFQQAEYGSLAIGNHPGCEKPLVNTDRRIFKDCPDLDRELPLCVSAFALECLLRFHKTHVIASTGRANNLAIWPALRNKIGDAVLWLREVND